MLVVLDVFELDVVFVDRIVVVDKGETGIAAIDVVVVGL